MTYAARLCSFIALLVACVCACRKSEPEPLTPETPAAQSAALEPAKAPSDAPAAQAPAAPGAAPQPSTPTAQPPSQPAYNTAPPHTYDAEHPWLGPGWSKLSMKDETKFCVFASKAEREAGTLIEKVKKQTLAADTPVVFGAFGPWCLNKECDALPNLQCWVDMEGENTIVLSTRFSSFHKDDAKCTKDCMALDASCETPSLPKGTYTIKHGERTYKLQIPSTVKQPCLNLK